MTTTRPGRICTIVAVWMLLLGAMTGCGADDGGASFDEGDEHRSNEESSSGSNADGDAGVTDAVDDGRADATSDPGSRYDASLADLGPVDSERCETRVFEPSADLEDDDEDDDRDDDERRRAHFFVASYELDFDALSSQGDFREHIHQYVRREVLSCLPSEGPSAIVFPDSMSLPMRFIGEKARSARELDDSLDAMSALIDEVEPAFAHYTEVFPGGSTDKHFLLALTDTVVRATFDTFGQIARRYGVYVSVSVDLPRYERIEDSSRVDRLADPDYVDHDYAYEAVDDSIHTRHLLFGPDGKLVDDQPAPFPADYDADTFGIDGGDFTQVSPFEAPWGRTAAVPGDSAWMPDVQDRLDDLGARVLLQPSAQKDGWVTPRDDAQEGLWKPDAFMHGAWNLVQRSPRMHRGFVPQMTGRYFEAVVDGQVQFVEQAHPHASQAAFVGQPEELHGNWFIGPWVIDGSDPLFDGESGQVRRELRRVADQLSEDSDDQDYQTDFVDDVWGASVEVPDDDGDAQIQTHPTLAYADQTGYLASSRGSIGERAIVLERVDESAREEIGRLHPSQVDAIRPTLAVDTTKLHLVFEAVEEDANRLMYAAYDLQDHQLEEPILIDEDITGSWAFHPSLVVHGDTLHLGFVRHSEGKKEAYYVQTNASEPFGRANVETALDDAPQSASGQRANQWGVRLAATYSTIAAVWLDFRNGRWEVFASASHDGGLSWASPERLDAAPPGLETYHATPSVEAIAQERFAVAWVDGRADRPGTRVATATFRTNASQGLQRETHHVIDEEAGPQRWRWRPHIVHDGRTTRVFYESYDHGYWSLAHNELDGLGTPLATRTTEPASKTPKHFPVVAMQGDQRFFAWEEVDPSNPDDSEIVFERRTY